MKLHFLVAMLACVGLLYAEDPLDPTAAAAITAGEASTFAGEAECLAQHALNAQGNNETVFPICWLMALRINELRNVAPEKQTDTIKKFKNTTYRKIQDICQADGGTMPTIATLAASLSRSAGGVMDGMDSSTTCTHLKNVTISLQRVVASSLSDSVTEEDAAPHVALMQSIYDILHEGWWYQVWSYNEMDARIALAGCWCLSGKLASKMAENSATRTLLLTLHRNIRDSGAMTPYRRAASGGGLLDLLGLFKEE